MSASRRFHFYLPADLESRLRTTASRRGVTLAVAIRELAAHALEIEERRPANGGSVENALLLAAVVAAEHAVLMVASVLPDGQRRIHELAPQAVLAAEERMAAFREAERE